MKTVQLALCAALVLLAFVPTASACCIHTTRAVAWAEYATADGELRCAVVSSPTPAQEGGCTLAVEGEGFHLVVLDSLAPTVTFSWEACGASGSAVGAGYVAVPAGCDAARIVLGPEATAGVLRQRVF